MSTTITVAQGCLACDTYVELDDADARCFLARFSRYQNELAKSSEERVSIDLTVCVERKNEKTSDGYSQKARGVEDLTVVDPDDVLRTIRNKIERRDRYTLDREGLGCVKKVLEKRKGVYSPSVSIDLLKDC
jgi:hypothetical protein